MPLLRQGPGLLRGAARVGVAAGVAGRVQHRQQERWAAEDQAQQVQQAPPAPAADPGGADYTAELEKLGAEPTGLFNEEDLLAVAETLDPGSSAAVLAWENVWAKGVAGAIRDAGGELYDYDRVPHEIVVAAREWAQANA